MRAALIGSGGPVLGREYPLDAEVVTIGRRDENTIVIKDPTVSRNHAEIRRAGDDFLIEDKGSTSGVVVNGQTIEGEYRLRDGDRIGVGNSALFTVQLEPVESRTVTFSRDQLPEPSDGRTVAFSRGDLASYQPPPPEPREPSATQGAAQAYQDAGHTGFMPPIEPLSGSQAPHGHVAPPSADFAPPQPRPEPLQAPSLPPLQAPSLPPRQEQAAPPQFATPPPPAPTFSQQPPAAPQFGQQPGYGQPAQQPPQSPQYGSAAPDLPPLAPPNVGGPPMFGGQAPPPAINMPGQFDQRPNLGGPGAPGMSAPPQAFSAPPPPPPPAKKSRTGLVIGLTVLLILILAALAVVALLLLR